MATAQISTKRVAISKANAQMLAIVAVATFVTIFCLMASKAAISQNRYQARVTKVKEVANTQLKANIDSFNELQNSYKKFDDATTNAIGGSHDGDQANDGSNSKVVLDALPSSYDFPALGSSIEKILFDQHLSVGGIQGVDDELAQQANLTSPSPQAVVMPFSFSVDNANYQAVQTLIDKLQTSIRPIQVDSLNLGGGGTTMTMAINAHTYYQPGKSVNISKQVVK